MAILETTIESLAERVTAGLESSLESAIKAELMKQADVIVSDIARKMAKSLRANIATYQDYPNDRLMVHLVLDGVKELVPAKGE